MAAVHDSDGEEKDVKIVLFGPGASGKSTLLQRVLRDVFLEEDDPSIEDEFRGRIGDTRVRFLDTAGSEDFEAMYRPWAEDADGIAFFVSSTTASPEDTADRFEAVRRALLPAEMPPCVLVVTKADLRDAEQHHHHHLLTEADVGALSARMGGLSVFVTSAKTPESAPSPPSAPFEHLLQLIASSSSQPSQRRHKANKCAQQ